MRQADAREIGGMLGFGIEADAAAGFRLLGADQLQYLLEGGDRVEAVEAAVGGPKLRQPFAGAQRAQFRVREILRAPAGDGLAVDGLAGPARGEFGVSGRSG